MPVHDLLTSLQNGATARIRSVPLPYSKAALGITAILLQHGFIHNVTRGTLRGPSPTTFLEASPARRRLWVDLKYGKDDHSVLGHALPVSKPSKKVEMDARELLRFVTGRRAQFVSPLQLGEIAVVKCRARESAASESTSAEAGAQPVKSMQSQAASAALATDFKATQASKKKRQKVERWLEAREAVGRGLGGEVIARIG